MLLNTTGTNMVQIVGACAEQIYALDPRDQTEKLTLVDMISGMWHCGFGHGIPGAKSPDELSAAFIKYTLEERTVLAERLSQLFGYPGVMIFRTGSEATDAAIRVAFTLAKGRTKILALEEGYHGCTGFAAMAGRDLNRIGIPDSFKELTDGGTIGRWAMSDTVDKALMEDELAKINWSELAAFIFEPVQGSAGGWALNPLVYEAIATKCQENGVFVIADEIMTGVGRCGYLALTETYSVKPDMLLLGKMLGNEQPISALLVSQTITDKNTRLHRTGFYATTTAGSRACCQRALAVLDQVTAPGFLEGVRERSEHLCRYFKETFEGRPGVEWVQANGLFFGLKTRSEDLARTVHLELLTDGKFGFSIDLSGRKLRFCPMLQMNPGTVKQAFDATARCLDKWVERSQ